MNYGTIVVLITSECVYEPSFNYPARRGEMEPSRMPSQNTNFAREKLLYIISFYDKLKLLFTA